MTATAPYMYERVMSVRVTIVLGLGMSEVVWVENLRGTVKYKDIGSLEMDDAPPDDFEPETNRDLSLGEFCLLRGMARYSRDRGLGLIRDGGFWPRRPREAGASRCR